METLIVILTWVLCGLIVGLIARWLVPRAMPMGLLGTIVLGIVGAFVGGLIYRILLGSPMEPFGFSLDAWRSWAFAILGAVLVLWLFSRWQRGRSWRRWW
jgi:uncharacterized membrane protein YeaQ/YmgE (transglycosylase-associated protein family)